MLLISRLLNTLLCLTDQYRFIVTVTRSMTLKLMGCKF